MSKLYRSCQFENAFSPSKIGFWEVPRYSCEIPATRIGKSEIISNKRGHILPGFPKNINAPWSDYIGTWHMPKRIDRKTADILNGSTAAKQAKIKCREQAKIKARDLRERLQIKKAKHKKPIITKKPDIDLEKLCPIHDLRVKYF